MHYRLLRAIMFDSVSVQFIIMLKNLKGLC